MINQSLRPFNVCPLGYKNWITRANRSDKGLTLESSAFEFLYEVTINHITAIPSKQVQLTFQKVEKSLLTKPLIL